MYRALARISSVPACLLWRIDAIVVYLSLRNVGVCTHPLCFAIGDFLPHRRFRKVVLFFLVWGKSQNDTVVTADQFLSCSLNFLPYRRFRKVVFFYREEQFPKRHGSNGGSAELLPSHLEVEASVPDA